MHEFFTFRPENRINTIISMNIFPMEEKFLNLLFIHLIVGA